MAAPSPQPKPSWLQRLRQRLAQLRSSDVIITTIAPGANDNVVGKNIIKIGTLVVPALPVVIALVVALVSGAGGLWFYEVPAHMPKDKGTFNIAVAEFSQIDAQRRERVTADSSVISATLFTTIQKELQQQSLSGDNPAIVWHDSMNLFQKRATIGAIMGVDDQDRAKAARKRAEALGADIIVYGALDTSTNPALLRLQFYAHDASRKRDMGSLQEFQQVDRLGGPVTVVLPLNSNSVSTDINPELRVRTTLLAKLVVGLRYELSSNTNFNSSLTRALDVFTDTLAYLMKTEKKANRSNGGDIVQYYIGREHFLLFQDAKTNPALANERQAHLDAALAAFRIAIELNPQYARAQSALGGAYYQRSQQLPRPQRLSTNDMADTIAAYQSAIAAAQAAKDTAAEAEANLGLAQTYWLQGDSFLNLTPSDPASSQVAFVRADQPLAAGEALIQPEQNRLRGLAAMVRGLIAHDRAQVALRAGDKANGRAFLEQARVSYGQCIAAGEVDLGDQFLQQQLIAPTCAPYEKLVVQALQ